MRVESKIGPKLGLRANPEILIGKPQNTEKAQEEAAIAKSSFSFLANRFTPSNGDNYAISLHFRQLVRASYWLTKNKCEVRFPPGTTITSSYGHTIPIKTEEGKVESHALWFNRRIRSDGQIMGIFKFNEKAIRVNGVIHTLGEAIEV